MGQICRKRDGKRQEEVGKGTGGHKVGGIVVRHRHVIPEGRSEGEVGGA